VTDTWLITGGAGFIGRALVRRVLSEGHCVVVLDAMTYAAHPAALRRLGDDEQLIVVEGDVADAQFVAAVFEAAEPTVVVDAAAHSHVDRSLEDAAPFIRTNATGAWVVAQASLDAGARLVRVSTDEVYGDRAGRPASQEGDPVRPTNPYSASKAAGDALVASLVRSHGLDAVITRGVNTYGPGQYPEKLLPLAAQRWADGASMGVYGDGLQERDWLYVDDHADAIVAAAYLGRAGHTLHFAGAGPVANRALLALWRSALGHPDDDDGLEEVDDRPGHDRRYDLDDKATRRLLSWSPRTDLEAGLAATARWTRRHPDFWSTHCEDA